LGVIVAVFGRSSHDSRGFFLGLLFFAVSRMVLFSVCGG